MNWMRKTTLQSFSLKSYPGFLMMPWISANCQVGSRGRALAFLWHWTSDSWMMGASIPTLLNPCFAHRSQTRPSTNFKSGEPIDRVAGDFWYIALSLVGFD